MWYKTELLLNSEDFSNTKVKVDTAEVTIITVKIDKASTCTMEGWTEEICRQAAGLLWLTPAQKRISCTLRLLNRCLANNSTTFLAPTNKNKQVRVM